MGMLALLGTDKARAASEECSSAVEAYNSAMEDVSYVLKRYSVCVGDSRGRDDCSSEFRRVKNAQDDFETAVAAYGSECED